MLGGEERSCLNSIKNMVENANIPRAKVILRKKIFKTSEKNEVMIVIFGILKKSDGI